MSEYGKHGDEDDFDFDEKLIICSSVPKLLRRCALATMSCPT